MRSRDTSPKESKEPIMPKSDSPHSFPFRRALGSVLLFCGLLMLSGCGKTDPLVALRDMGADFKRTRERVVELVRLPKSAEDDALDYVADLNRPDGVKLLDLSGTQITDAGLAKLDGLKGLETLNLNDTGITDEGLKHLEALQSLTDLRLANTNITNEGLTNLVDKLPNLKALDVAGNPKPTPPEPRTWKSALNFGIDLAGGTNLVYQVDRQEIIRKQHELQSTGQAGSKQSAQVTSQVMDQMVAAVSRRLNPSGVEEITVRKVGSDRIEVIIPKASPEVVERKKRQMTRLGSLEFALLANSRDHDAIIRDMQDPDNADQDLLREDGTLLAGWRAVGVNANGTPKEIGQGGDVVSKMVNVNGQDMEHYLVVFGRTEERVTGQYLSRAYETTDENGRLAVGFLFNQQGGYRFQNLTSTNKPSTDGFERRLSILLDNKIHSAPSIKTTISDQGQITGSFTREEIEELIGVLNAGALTVPMQEKPISELSVSPILGEEVQRDGIRSILVAGGLVVLFMIGYYLFAGVIAVICLVLNILLIMGSMALIDATFTLPGLAGIVLTIGMAVDTNVLIFERMREELRRGASLRMCIQNGFDRALSAIVDSNITTLISAVVLYVIGTDQVRGFAVTLFIGILMSMFTALYFGRLLFDIAERKRWITTLKMFTILSGDTRWGFIKYWKPVTAATGLMILIGLGVFAMRGEDNFDIDFRGGTMLTFRLTEEQKIEDVRDALESQFPDEAITLETLTQEGLETSDPTKGVLFRVRSEQPNVEVVADRVTAAMQEKGFQLKRIEMTPKVEDLDKNIADLEPAELAAISNVPKRAGFEGGHKIALAFPNGITKGELETYFERAMEGLGDEGEPKYSRSRLGQLTFIKYPTGTSPTPPEAEAERVDEAELWVASAVDRADFLTALNTLEAPQFEGKNSFASSVADEMKISAIQAIVVSMIGMVIYLWFRFENINFGLAAVIALVHDVLAVVAVMALVSYAAAEWNLTFLGTQDFKINLPIIAALMTLVGYSVNDTIVMFDRIREVRGKNPAMTEEMIDISVNQTLSRTILTAWTVWIVVIVLYFLGGPGIHGFAFSLVIGVVVGTYSSIYISCPFLLYMFNRKNKGQKAKSESQPAKAAAG